jgi:hypothetical protein
VLRVKQCLLLHCLVCLLVQVCKLSWLSTTEAFPVDGLRTAPQRRRDMRSGKHSNAAIK